MSHQIGITDGIHANLVKIVVIAILPFLLYGALYPAVYAGHQWQQDEVAFVYSSLKHTPSQWFTEGYARYFDVYPEWWRPLTNFLRPFSNLTVVVAHALFGENRALYFLTAYVPLSINGVLVFVILRKLALAEGLALALSVLAMATPAALGIALWQLPFQPDLWGSSFALGAFLLLAQRRYVGSFCCLLLCVWTKESVLFAPAAAALSAWFVFRARLAAVGLFVPAAIWLGWRILMFGSLASGVYTLGSNYAGGSVIAKVLSTLTTALQWPLGLSASHTIFGALASGSASDIVLKALVPAFANACLWLLLIVACFHTARFLWRRSALAGATAAAIDERSALRHLAAIWLACAVGWALVAGLQTRMGAAVYVFLVIVIGALLAELPRSRPIRLLAIASSIALFGASAVAAKNWAETPMRNEAEQALIAALKEMQGSGPVYVVNAPSTYSSPRFYAAMYGGGRPLVFLNQFEGCRSLPLPEVASGTEVRVELPSCATLFFANVLPEIFAESDKSSIGRKDVGTYNFVGASVRKSQGIVFTAEHLKVDLGRRMRIGLAAPPSHILAYDGQSGKYVEVFTRSDASR